MYQLSRSKIDVQNAFLEVDHKEDYQPPIQIRKKPFWKSEEMIHSIPSEWEPDPYKPATSIWQPIYNPDTVDSSSEPAVPYKQPDSIWEPIFKPSDKPVAVPAVPYKQPASIWEPIWKTQNNSVSENQIEESEESHKDAIESVPDELADESVDEPADESVDEFANELADELADESVDEPADEPVDEPADEPVDEEEDAIQEIEKKYREPLENPVVYDYLGESYYLDNHKFLQRSYDDIPQGDYAANLCIYKCIRQGLYPYLLYLMVYDKSKRALVFPSFSDLIKIKETDSDEEIENTVSNAFKTTLFDIFPPGQKRSLDIESETATDVYHPDLVAGFFLTEEDMWITYDATRVDVDTATDKEYFWVSPFEVLVLYQFRNIEIDISVISFFKTVATSQSSEIDPSFYQLKRVSDRSFLPAPYILFLCSPSSSGFFGLSENFENVEQEKDDVINLLVPSIKHPQLGNFPLFSSLPLDKFVPKIKRYACFVDIEEPPLFLFDYPGEINHLYDITQQSKFSTISFMFNEKQYWSIKSPLYFTEIYDDLDRFIPVDFEEEHHLNPISNVNEPVPESSDLLEREGSDLDGISNDEIEINEDISVVESETYSNDERENRP
jgi:hypothetical protein